MNTLRNLTLAVALAAASLAQAQTLESVVLPDMVVAGSGDIALFKGLNAASLEALRQAHNQRLVFGIDVREAASGTEKSSSQAVAVQAAWLEVSFADGSSRSYGNRADSRYQTQTGALLVPAGSSQRGRYATLLGDEGISRPSAANAVQRGFDSTLTIPVADSLSGATAAVLHLRWLSPDTVRRDPEAFYDYSGSAERVAVLNPADAQYLDQTLPTQALFRREAPAVLLSTTPTSSAGTAWTHYPGINSHYYSAFEDSDQGTPDYDYNDAVVAYHYQFAINASGQVERMHGTAHLVARGSHYSHDWYLNLALPNGTSLTDPHCTTTSASGQSLLCQVTQENSQLRWRAFADTRSLLPQALSANTTSVSVGPAAHFSVSFNPPVALSKLSPAQPSLQINDTATTLTTSQRDRRGYPPVLVVPQQWRIVREGTDIGSAYPELVGFIANEGRQQTNWYLRPNTTLVLPAVQLPNVAE